MKEEDSSLKGNTENNYLANIFLNNKDSLNVEANLKTDSDGPSSV